MNNGGAASQWSNAAWQQQQLQWNSWQQGQGAAAQDWNQGWASALAQQQPGWQSGAAGGWGQDATTGTSSSSGQWKSYGSASTGAGGATSGAGGAAGGAAGQWNGQQWTGGSY